MSASDNATAGYARAVCTILLILSVSACNDRDDTHLGKYSTNNYAPTFVNSSSISVEENTIATGYTAVATDADGDDLTFSVGGTDSALLSIGANTGVLDFVVAPDFESPADSDTDNIYLVDIILSDGSLTATQPVNIYITNSNDNNPVLISGTTASVSENTTATGYTAVATDTDGDLISFSLSGADQAAFTIDSSSGVLSLVAAPDFEMPADSDANNSYVVDVIASDGSLTTTQTVTINVLNSNDNPPVFTSGATGIAVENTLVTAYTAVAPDADGDTVSFSLSGTDQALFSIDSSSGVLSFVATPDFEVPADSDANNSYVVDVIASDGLSSTIQTVTLTVTDLDEAPVFVSGTAVTVDENLTGTAYTAMAIDPESTPVTYSLSGGADQSLFTLDSNSGVLEYIVAPDFESPADSDANNSYVVDVTALDGTLATTQTVTVNVRDRLEDLTISNGGIKTLQFDWFPLTGAAYYRLNINPDGASGFSLVEDNIFATTTTTIIPVHLSDWINASYIVEAYDGSGALMDSTPAASISSLMLTSIGYFKASNTTAAAIGFPNDLFGYRLTLSADGTTLAVSALYEASNATGINGDESDNSMAGSGAVYLFRHDTGSNTWAQQAYIKASNTGSFDQFGYTVALSDDGNTLAVSTSAEASNATGINGNETDNTLSNAGAVYVFRFDSGTSSWVQQAYVKASNTGAGDQFGSSVTLSADGNTLAVGAQREGSNATGINGDQLNNLGGFSGAAYVYRYDTGTSNWAQQAYVKASNTGGSDQFGYAVALSNDGHTLAVSAPGEDSDATDINGDQSNDLASGSGAVYVFRFNTGTSTWGQEAYVKASNTGASDQFGLSLALSGDGDTLGVSAVSEDSDATGVNGDESNDFTNNSGAAYLFRYDTGTSAWAQQAYIKASNTGANDSFGRDVGLSDDGDIFAVGASAEASLATGINGDQTADSPPASNFSGAAYVYRYDTGTVSWAQTAYVKAPTTDGLEYFGWSVALSSDGATLAVGAPTEDSNAIGINGDQSNNDSFFAGAAYLY